MPVIDIIRIEKALIVDIPDYIYLNIHKKKFASSIEGIQRNEYIIKFSTSNRTVGLRTRDGELQCVYQYQHNTPFYGRNRLNSDIFSSNALFTFSPNLSKSFTKRITDTKRKVFIVRSTVEYSPNIHLVPKGDKSQYRLGSIKKEFLDSSYIAVFFENKIGDIEY